MTQGQATIVANNSTVYAAALRIVGFIGEEGVRHTWQRRYEEALKSNASDYSIGAFKTPTTKEQQNA